MTVHKYIHQAALKSVRHSHCRLLIHLHWCSHYILYMFLKRVLGVDKEHLKMKCSLCRTTLHSQDVTDDPNAPHVGGLGHGLVVDHLGCHKLRSSMHHLQRCVAICHERKMHTLRQHSTYFIYHNEHNEIPYLRKWHNGISTPAKVRMCKLASRCS